MKQKIALLLGCLTLWSAQTASAHITLEQESAPAGSAYKAVFRVGHGCDGSATNSITVQIPAGFQNAKPMPKPGWSLKVKRAKLQQPYNLYGHWIFEDVIEVQWRAGGMAHTLPDAYYDEFILRGSLPPSGGPMWFRVIQDCEQGRKMWVQIPAQGISTEGLKEPAALLMVEPTAPGPKAGGPLSMPLPMMEHKH